MLTGFYKLKKCGVPSGNTERLIQPVGVPKRIRAKNILNPFIQWLALASAKISEVCSASSSSMLSALSFVISL
jgi:hypothetical protein